MVGYGVPPRYKERIKEIKEKDQFMEQRERVVKGAVGFVVRGSQTPSS